jgi:hypothetical protein
LLSLTGCDLMSSARTPLALPSWILGVWKDSGSFVTFTFTPDDAVMISSSVHVDYKAVDAFSSGNNDIYDSSTSTSYSIMLKSAGTLIQTVRFDQ